MNKKGKGSWLVLVIILVVALMIAFLVMKNMGSLRPGNGDSAQQENYIQQAQSVVDQINQAQQQAAQEP